MKGTVYTYEKNSTCFSIRALASAVGDVLGRRFSVGLEVYRLCERGLRNRKLGCCPVGTLDVGS